MTPWLGLSLRPPGHGDGLVVAAVAANGPNSGRIAPGARLLALRDGSGKAVRLSHMDLLEDPDHFTEYADYMHFFERQDRLIAILAGGQAQGRLEGAGWQPLYGAPFRPPSALPFVYWYQLGLALLALLTSWMVYAYRPGPATRWYACSGFGLFIVIGCAGVYSSRELAMPAPLLFVLSNATHFGGLLFSGAFLSLLCVYPRRLVRPAVTAGIVAVAMGLYVLHTLRIPPDMEWGFRIPVTATLFVSVAIAVVQWRGTRHQPVARAALKWFLFAWFTGSSLFLALVFVPLILDYPLPLPQRYLWGVLVGCYIAMPLGLARVRLPLLDRWWPTAWAGLIATVAVFLVDMLLVSHWRWHPVITILVAFTLVGWLFFPLRHWLWRRLTAPQRQRAAERLSVAVRLLIDAGSGLHPPQPWAAALRILFQPQQLESVPNACLDTRVIDDGSRLQIAGVGPLPSMMLDGADGASRLFTRDDERLAQTLAGLFAHLLAQQQAVAQSAKQRERLYRDLHDDLGSKLLSLVYRAHDPQAADLARAALEDMRDTVTRRPQGHRPLAAVCEDWHREAAQRLDAANIALSWTAPEPLPVIDVPVRWHLAGGRVLREAVSNIIRHAGPAAVAITLALDGDALTVTIIHDGQVGDPADWCSGRGTAGMRARLRELGGEIEWRLAGPATLRTWWRVSLPATASEGATAR